METKKIVFKRLSKVLSVNEMKKVTGGYGNGSDCSYGTSSCDGTEYCTSSDGKWNGYCSLIDFNGTYFCGCVGG